MRLQQQTLDLAALGILLLFDQMERQLERGGRSQPFLQAAKLEARGAVEKWSWERGSSEVHNLTVLLLQDIFSWPPDLAKLKSQWIPNASRH